MEKITACYSLENMIFLFSAQWRKAYTYRIAEKLHAFPWHLKCGAFRDDIRRANLRLIECPRASPSL